jgi:hypothetical protein
VIKNKKKPICTYIELNSAAIGVLASKQVIRNAVISKAALIKVKRQ